MRFFFFLTILSFFFVNEALARAPYDFDGDNKTDISIYRPSTGEWWVKKSSNSQWLSIQFGTSTDVIVPADYTGDGKDDFAVYRPSTGQWFIARSENFSFYAIQFGISTDKPVPADYDGDGKADIAVYRKSEGMWYIFQSTGGIRYERFGIPDSDDNPVPADYDGDGKTDVAIQRAQQWWLLKSTQGLALIEFGGGGISPVVGDYTGDGKADMAYYFNDLWHIRQSEDGFRFSILFGAAAGQRLAAGDYDGDGKFDLALFLVGQNVDNWRIRLSSNSQTVTDTFGVFTDKSVPNAYTPIF